MLRSLNDSEKTQIATTIIAKSSMNERCKKSSHVVTSAPLASSVRWNVRRLLPSTQGNIDVRVSATGQNTWRNISALRNTFAMMIVHYNQSSSVSAHHNPSSSARRHANPSSSESKCVNGKSRNMR